MKLLLSFPHDYFCEQLPGGGGGGDNFNKRCLSNTVCNFKSSRKFGRSSRILNRSKYKFHSMSRFFSTVTQNCVISPRKIPVSRFPEEFCFSPETGTVSGAKHGHSYFIKQQKAKQSLVEITNLA